MKSLIAAIAITLALVGSALAKDHSDVSQMGTLTKVPLHVAGKVSTGYTDTTDCNSGLLGVHCTGGIVDDYAGKLIATLPDGKRFLIGPCAEGASLSATLFPCSQPYVLMLTKEDGASVFIRHTWGHHNSTRELDTASKVLYRTKHVRGLMSVDYVMIPDPDNPNKEGTYDVFKPKTIPPEKDAPAPASDNIKAMCESGRLSSELKAKYCTPQVTPVPDQTPAPEAAPQTQSPAEQTKQAQHADCLKAAVDNPNIVCQQ